MATSAYVWTAKAYAATSGRALRSPLLAEDAANDIRVSGVLDAAEDV
jgi:hypothetical protein